MKKTLTADLSIYSEEQLVLIGKRTGYRAYTEQPVLDDEGNTLLDENGNQVTEQVSNPISREDHIVSKGVEAMFKFYSEILLSEYRKQQRQSETTLESQLKQLFNSSIIIE